MADTGIPAGYKRTEVGVIPKDWGVKELGEVGKLKNGINKSNEDFGFGSPFVNLMDIFGNTKIENNLNFGLINSNDAEKKLYDLIKGDVLFIRSSVKPSGVGLTCVIINNLQDTVFSGFLIRFRDKGLLTDGYKQHYFYNEKFRNNLISSSTVSANTNINQEALKKLIIAFPKDKIEQNAIATVLSDTDALINHLDKLIAKKVAIKQGAMQQLLTGKKRLPGFSGEWEEKKLGEYVTIESGESPSKFNFTDNGTPYYKVDQLNNGNKYQKDTPYFIECNNPILSGSIIFPKRGASILLNKVRILTEDSFMDTNLMTLTTSEELNNEYLYYMLIHIGLWHVADTTSIPQINNKHIKPIEIAFPFLPEQQSIAQILADMDTEIQALEQKQAKYKSIKQGMMQELLTGKTRLV